MTAYPCHLQDDGIFKQLCDDVDYAELQSFIEIANYNVARGNGLYGTLTSIEDKARRIQTMMEYDAFVIKREFIKRGVA